MTNIIMILNQTYKLDKFNSSTCGFTMVFSDHRGQLICPRGEVPLCYLAALSQYLWPVSDLPCRSGPVSRMYDSWLLHPPQTMQYAPWHTVRQHIRSVINFFKLAPLLIQVFLWAWLSPSTLGSEASSWALHTSLSTWDSLTWTCTPVYPFSLNAAVS